jgi:hypothetical protein
MAFTAAQVQVIWAKRGLKKIKERIKVRVMF